MISVDLALRLKAAGLEWHPAAGDRFVIPDRDMDEDVFTLSDMTVEVHDHPTGRVIGFNGTTEWALDSVDQPEACWLPAEHQLRELLGERFTRLERRDVGDGVVHRVLLLDEHGADAFEAPDPADAYAQALLHHLSGAAGGSSGTAGSTTAAT
ncbi:pilus assembly protein CpaE [Kineococcus indalonis]|uniref:pilus assembly protein CpaE n=1 Tax=Kineococcus indalonis TaxID=2696566 RepID=UPI001411EC2B|nr:pilus assembly protein CpaE [Kineococcus indalonis]NAZ87304.1 pilus assembly protein CpaE [Kineococcus indalonis]